MGNTLRTTKESLVKSPNGQDFNSITAVAVENIEGDKTLHIMKDKISLRRFGNTGPGVKVIITFQSKHGDIWQEEYRFENGDTFKRMHEVDAGNDIGTEVIWCNDEIEREGKE